MYLATYLHQSFNQIPRFCFFNNKNAVTLYLSMLLFMSVVLIIGFEDFINLVYIYFSQTKVGYYACQNLNICKGIEKLFLPHNEYRPFF